MADNIADDAQRIHSNRGEEQPARQPPIVVFADNSPSKLAERLQRVARELNSEVYGTPRVFDLYTMMAVTLAFALLFGFIRLLKPILPDETQAASISISIYVTGIAIAQSALWGGRCPRRSSLVAGPLMWVAVSGSLAWWKGGLPLSVGLVLSLCTAPLGLIAGYLAGAVVAGVFLVADALRFKSKSSAPFETEDQQDDLFDRLE